MVFKYWRKALLIRNCQRRQQADALYVKRVFDAMQQTELEVADLLCDYYNLLCVSLINSRYPNAEEWLKEMEEKVSA
jgi:hypothetical protein